MGVRTGPWSDQARRVYPVVADPEPASTKPLPILDRTLALRVFCFILRRLALVLVLRFALSISRGLAQARLHRGAVLQVTFGVEPADMKSPGPGQCWVFWVLRVSVGRGLWSE